MTARRALLSFAFLGCALLSSCTRPQYGGPHQSPGVSVETSLLSGSDQKGKSARGAGQASPAPASQRQQGHGPKSWGPHGSLPDPEPLSNERQWQYELLYDSGNLSVLSVELRTFDKPITTARQMGRFAIELWRGRELIERVRFDFPMLAAEEPTAEGGSPLSRPPDLSAHAKVRRRVLVPDAKRPNRAILVDRAAGKELPLAWPPAPDEPGRSSP